MLDIKNPEINVDEIMQRIQEKVRLRQAQSAPANGAPSAPPSQSPLAFNQLLAQARERVAIAYTSALAAHAKARADALAEDHGRVRAALPGGSRRICGPEPASSAPR